MHRNESLLIAASYFWSDTPNAFVFGHDPASPTVADVAMLTGLDVSSADSTHFFDTKPKAKVETHAIDGCSGYIQKYSRTGPINIKEQTCFLNMWLDKFMCCGRSAGPTSVYLAAAENLANGGRFALGRYLLGAAYSATWEAPGGSSTCGSISICTSVLSLTFLHSIFQGT